METDLLEWMEQEIKILRNLLGNQAQEQQALLHQDVKQLDYIIDERLELIEAFERVSEQLIEFSRQLAQLHGKELIEGEELSHQQALQILEEFISYQEIDLKAGLDQLKAILAQIQNQNAITHYFLQRQDLQLEPVASQIHRQLSKIEPSTSTRKKLLLAVLDPLTGKDDH